LESKIGVVRRYLGWHMCGSRRWRMEIPLLRMGCSQITLTDINPELNYPAIILPRGGWVKTGRLERPHPTTKYSVRNANAVANRSYFSRKKKSLFLTIWEKFGEFVCQRPSWNCYVSESHWMVMPVLQLKTKVQIDKW